MSEIELNQVSKHFAGITAVKQASFTVHDGEFFILVGPSGCGKSTLLNMIVGLEALSEGEIRVDGERVDDLDPKDRNMAMVFQSYAIYPHMTVRENMAFPLRLAKLSRAEIHKRVARVAETLELEDYLERRPAALSGGQRQRVAMGRAMVREPKAFLLDEPLSNLDAKLRMQMRTEIARLQTRLQTTTVYVTHDQTEAMTLGDRIAVMRQGEVLQIGTPRELYERPRNLFVAGFIGAPAMNFVPARRVQGRLELPFGTLDTAQIDIPASDDTEESLVAGFRPEHLRVAEGEQDNGLRVEAEVEVVEWLGADLFIYFQLDLRGFEAVRLPEELETGTGRHNTNTMVGRIDPGLGVREGDRLSLCLDPNQLQLFDALSGERLSRPQGQ